jgi:hypothetical protein
MGCVAACATGNKNIPQTSPDEVVFGTYRGRSTDADGGRVSFRVWLWAEQPGRLHAEIFPPVGGPSWILDAGKGRMSVTDLRRGVSWEGQEEPGLLLRWLGITLDVSGLVNAILGNGGHVPSAVRSREPDGIPGLPLRIELATNDFGTLVLERTGFQVAPRGRLGTGMSPNTVDVRPIAELDENALRSAEESGKP